MKLDDLIIKEGLLERNNYDKLEKGGYLVLLQLVANIIKDRFWQMKNPEVNHEFAGFLYGQQSGDRIVIYGLDESYSNAQWGSCSVILNPANETGFKARG